MHDKHWVHRDIKPENILVNKAGEVRLIDLALALRRSGPGWRGCSGGSPSDRGRRATYRLGRSGASLAAPSADIYSFGVTCYELACGRPPFRGNSTTELLNKHLSERPAPLTTHNNAVTSEFYDLVMQMIQKKPEARSGQHARFRDQVLADPDLQGRPRPDGRPLTVRCGPNRTTPSRPAAPVSVAADPDPKDVSPMARPSEHRLPFEAPIYEMEARLTEMEASYAKNRVGGEISGLAEQTRRLRRELAALKRTIYANLDPWQTVQVARHPQRPQTRDYIDLIFDQFVELHGDRALGDDQAIVTGLGPPGR